MQQTHCDDVGPEKSGAAPAGSRHTKAKIRAGAADIQPSDRAELEALGRSVEHVSEIIAARHP
jgi:hypothetical protein